MMFYILSFETCHRSLFWQVRFLIIKWRRCKFISPPLPVAQRTGRVLHTSYHDVCATPSHVSPATLREQKIACRAPTLDRYSQERVSRTPFRCRRSVMRCGQSLTRGETEATVYTYTVSHKENPTQQRTRMADDSALVKTLRDLHTLNVSFWFRWFSMDV